MFHLVMALIPVLCAEPTIDSEPEIRDIGSRLELFVDDWLVAESNGAELRLNRPTPREVAIVFDQPWEGNTSGYVTVFQDGDLYRMYYRGSGKSNLQVTCYAESKDGVHFTRPKLGIFEFEGSKENNIVWMGNGSHNFAPMKDANPDCIADAKYKALGGGSTGLIPFKSSDGVHWTKMSEKPVIKEGAFDSQNLAFWDTHRNRYVDFHRGFRHGKRDIMTCTSSDFLEWTKPTWVEYPGSPAEHLYTNQTTPYFRAPHIFMAFPKRFEPSRKAVRHRHGGVSDGVFMTSRDGLKFHRWGEAFIRPGLHRDNWVNRNNMVAWGIVQTDCEPGFPDELSIYSSEGYYSGDSCRMRRYTVRQDGFVSMNAPMSGGEFVTHPMIFSGTDGLDERIHEVSEGPIQFDTSKPLRGKASLTFKDATTLTLPGTKDLGKQATLAVQVREIPTGHRRLFSAYNGGPFQPRELYFDINAGGSIGADGAIRFGYDGWKVMADHKLIGDWSAEKDPDTTHHIAATWNDGLVVLYFDGKKVAEGGTPGVGELTLALGDLRFGEDYPPTSQTNEPFLGSCDDILVLRRALTDSEIESLASKGAESVIKTDTEDGILYSMEGPQSSELQDHLVHDGNQKASVVALDQPGEVELILNYSTSAAGSIRCEIQDEEGAPIPGYTLAESDEIYGDHIERAVAWKGRRELKPLVGKPVRLRFVMKDADLYSIRFR